MIGVSKMVHYQPGFVRDYVEEVPPTREHIPSYRYIRIDAPELLAVVDALRHVAVAGALDEELRSNALKAWDEVVG